MIVSKFGGSSTASPKTLKNVCSLAKNKERKILVFSAIGKETKSDIKLTDLLISYTNAKDKEKCDWQEKIIKKVDKLCKNLQFNHFFIQKVNKNIKKLLKKYDNNYIISRGEYFTAKIMAKKLKIKFISAEKLIFFKNNTLNYEKITKKLKKSIKKYKKIVIPGFYGVDENKKIKLFARGGGDLTGAIVAKCLNAEVYENFTDVEGIKQVNPKYLKSKQIKNLSYKDLCFMTSCDCSVIQNECAKTLFGTNIVLKICSIKNLKKQPTVAMQHCNTQNCFVLVKQIENKQKNNIQFLLLVKTKNKLKILKANLTNLQTKLKQCYENILNFD